MADYTIFGAGTPTLADSNGDANPINVATAFNGTGLTGYRIKGVRIFIPAGSTHAFGVPTGAIYEGGDASSATVKVSKAFGAFVAGQWNDVIFDTPLALASGTTYWASVHLPGGGYGAEVGRLSTQVKAAGINLYARATDAAFPSNGAFSLSPAPAPPTSASLNASWFGVDVIVDDGVDSQTFDAAGSSGAGITDTAVAVRTGGPTTTTLTGRATDPLSVSDTDTKTVAISGSSIRTVRRSMWEDRVSLSSMEFVFWTNGPAFSDASPNEIGVEFTLDNPSKIVGTRIYKHPEAAGDIVVTLWSGAGAILARKTVVWNADEGGWRTVMFDNAPDIGVDTPVTMSYFAANGKWAYNEWVFNDMTYYEFPFKVSAYNPDTQSYAGRYSGDPAGANTYPTLNTTYNYYVDPIAEWVEDTPAAGTNYLEQFPNGGSSFDFPMAVFYPEPPFLEDYASIGVNTACGVPVYESGYRDAIVASGMDAWCSGDGSAKPAEFVQSDPVLAQQVKGYFLHDEPDMVHHEASPDQLWAMLSSLRKIDSSRPIFLNLGKWPVQSISYQWAPSGASVDFVTERWRRFGEIADVMSCDWYVITDQRTGIWAYPKMVQKMRQLSRGRLPIWGFVESCPVEESDPSPDQVKRATWACLIAGAQGIVFFDHRFAVTGYSVDHHSMLHTPAMRTAVTELCAQVQSVAAPLKALDAGLVTSVTSSNTTEGPIGGTFGVPMDYTTRIAGSSRYLFAQGGRPGSTNATFTIPSAAGKAITVLGEGRTVMANGSGVFTDAFNDGDYTYHLYRWTA